MDQSETKPNVACSNIGASASLLIATMTSARLIPTVWLGAPRTPIAMYSCGSIALPVRPTCNAPRHPSLVRHATVAHPGAERRARSPAAATPSGPPTPMPTPTTTAAPSSGAIELSSSECVAIVRLNAAASRGRTVSTAASRTLLAAASSSTHRRAP